MPRIKLKKPTPKYHVEVDWKAYYLDFEDVHGGHPMILEDQRKLLFRDGWRYNAFNHAGPEYPPPDDKQKRLDLQEKYWSMRMKIADDELWQCRGELQRLRDLRAVRSLPIKEKAGKLDDDGEPVEIATIITDEPFRFRIAELLRDKGECLVNLDRIAKERENHGTTQTANAGY